MMEDQVAEGTTGFEPRDLSPDPGGSQPRGVVHHNADRQPEPPPLVVTVYDAEWPRRFAEIRAVIQRTIPGTYHAVEHVGSTAVPGLAAKPIIDIDIVMRDEQFDRIRRGLESLGYVYEGDLGRPGRHAFDLRDPGLGTALAEHHLNVCEPGAEALRDHRDFRDFLLRHPDQIARLSARKLALAEQHAGDYYAYQRAKAPLVEEILALARQEKRTP